MKIEPGSSISLDTNILLDATDEGRKHHTMVRQALLTLASASGVDLFLATQVIREYLVVATRSVENNGLGLGIGTALWNIKEFRKLAATIPETVASSDRFLHWAAHYRMGGKKLHDLQILATTHQAGIREFLTGNPDDFPTDTGIRIIPLTELKL